MKYRRDESPANLNSSFSKLFSKVALSGPSSPTMSHCPIHRTKDGLYKALIETNYQVAVENHMLQRLIVVATMSTVRQSLLVSLAILLFLERMDNVEFL